LKVRAVRNLLCFRSLGEQQEISEIVDEIIALARFVVAGMSRPISSSAMLRSLWWISTR